MSHPVGRRGLQQLVAVGGSRQPGCERRAVPRAECLEGKRKSVGYRHAVSGAALPKRHTNPPDCRSLAALSTRCVRRAVRLHQERRRTRTQPRIQPKLLPLSQWQRGTQWHELRWASGAAAVAPPVRVVRLWI